MAINEEEKNVELLRQANMVNYIKTGDISVYGKKTTKVVSDIANRIEAKKEIEKITEEIESRNVLRPSNNNENMPKYNTNPKRENKTNLKKKLLNLLVWATIGSISLGGLAIGVHEHQEYNYTFEAERKISTVFASYKDGIEAYQGSSWYESDKFVEEIIQKNNHEDSDRLYYQLARIYTGLNDVTKGKEKLNDKEMNAYTAREWVEKIYIELNKKIKSQNGIGIGPESFKDWLKDINKLHPDKDPYEVMLDSYSQYLDAIENQIREGDPVVTLLPIEQVLQEKYGVKLN